MKKQFVIGVLAGIAGFAAAVAGTVTVYKIAKEMHADMSEASFTSPDGAHTVTIAFGASARANGLTLVKVQATSEVIEDTCKLIAFARKKEAFLAGEWIDNDRFQLLIGTGKRKQCCDVRFFGDQIVATYTLAKTEH